MHTGDSTHTPTPSDLGNFPAPVPLGYPARLEPVPWVGRVRSGLLADHLLVRADQHRRWIFAVVVLIYLAGFNAQWRLEPDSALYLSVGRNLADGRGYTFHGQPHRLAYPGLPLLFAATFKTLHTRSLVPALVLMLGTGLATLALTYRLFLLAADRPTAVIVTAGVAMSRVFYRYNFELLSDLPFLTGVLAFLVGYEALFHCRSGRKGRRSSQADFGNDGDNANGDEAGNGNGAARAIAYGSANGDANGTAAHDRFAPDLDPCRGRRRWFDLLLLVGGLATAVAMRPAMWALVLAVVAASVCGLLWSLLRKGVGGARWGQVLIGAAVIGAVALFYLRDPRHAERIFGVAPTAGPGYAEEDEMFNLRGERLRTMARHAIGSLPVFFDAITKASFGMPLDLGAVDGKWVFGTLMLVLGAGLYFYRPLWGLLVLATVAMILMVKPLDRYFVPLVPLLVFAWWRFCAAVNRRLPPRWANGAFLLLFLLGAAPNFGKVVGFVREQRHVPFLAAYKEGRYASVYAAADMIAAHTPPSVATDPAHATWVLVGPKFARIMTYLSGRYAIEPEIHSNLDPARQPLFVLGSLRPDPRGARDPRSQPVIDPGIRGWLADHHFHCERDPVARIPNREPTARGWWGALYRVAPDADPAAPTAETPAAPPAAPPVASQGKPAGP